jgi:SAM-dependent methyltransferase
VQAADYNRGMSAAFRRPLGVVLVTLALSTTATVFAQSPAPAAPPAVTNGPINPDDPDIRPGTPGKDVIFLPTPAEVVSAMLELAKVTQDDVVYDLGSGDGRTPIAAAKEHGARGVGVEFNPKLVALSRQNAEQAGVADRVRFINADLFQTDISEATVVTLYLLSSLNQKLLPKLQRELKPGTRIVSHAFSMGEDWKPDAERTVNGKTIYLWTVK